MKAKRLLAAFGFTLLLLILMVLAFGIVANTYRYPERPPKWLVTMVFGSFSWPFAAFNDLLPNTDCTDGYDACGGSTSAHLASAATVVLSYCAVFYALLSAWARRQRKKGTGR
ncbi:MAG: hypothetical protein QOD26_335 [Betaproteobacteria bacterium]|jgi:ABC-type Na+ efflux pump permease subunit|nr:hypothetical protein [Betaproteobacteria bacterium]